MIPRHASLRASGSARSAYERATDRGARLSTPETRRRALVKRVVQSDPDDIVRHMGSGGGACRAAVDEGGGECRIDRDREGFGDIAEIDIEIFKLRRPTAAKFGLDARADGPAELAGREVSRAGQERAGLQRTGEDRRIGCTRKGVTI